MNHTRFLKIALPAGAVLALVVLFLPIKISTIYISVLEPLFLLMGAILAFRVSFSYSRQLKSAFVFLSVYLCIYMLAIILLPYLMPRLGENAGGLVFIVQIITYYMLFLYCVNLLRVVRIKQLNRNGWIIFSITLVLCLFVAIYPPVIDDILSLSFPVISYIMIRILDAALIIVLVPVIWLYAQYLRSQQKQSLTLTVIVLGIVCCTVFDYIFEVVLLVFPQLLSQESYLHNNILEMLYIYGYLIIAVGLYAHLKHDEWGFKMIEKALG